MKAKTQKNIGLVTAGIMLIIGIYQLFLPAHSFPKLLGLLLTVILSAVYVFALTKKKLRIAQIVFRTWWVISIILISVIFLALIVTGKWTESFQNALMVLLILFCLVFPVGLITFLWWIGLQGLQRIVEATSEEREWSKKVVHNLKTKFKEWEEWLVGDDINSIRNQICDMIWDSAVFQSINECRRYAPANANGEIQINGVVHRFIDRCFFETQAIAIRRIIDTRNDVTSLYRLINDIEKNRHLLTRQNILAVHNYPYEYEREKKRISDETFKKSPGPHVMGEDYRRCEISKYTHKFIDSLAGVEPSKRKPHDCVRPQVFQWLQQRLNRCREIKTFVNKFLAHSATPESRNYRNPPELDITLGQILEAHKIICKTAIFISGQMGILSEGHGLGNVLAVPQYDQFIHFDKVWASEETIEKLRKFWCSYDIETRDWHNWSWEDDFKKFLSK